MLALLLATVVAHPVALEDGRRFPLNVPEGYEMRVAAEGLRRVRFMAMAPDGRLFVTDLYNRSATRAAGSTHWKDSISRTCAIRTASLDGGNYGWPYCYIAGKRVRADSRFGSRSCKDVPLPLAIFPAHASPLGLEHFGEDGFLVALHGSSKKSLDHGYRVARVDGKGNVEDFITGFLKGNKVLGRPRHR